MPIVNCALVPEQTIDEVPALKVKFVGVPTEKTVPLLLRVIVLLPKLTVLVLLPAAENTPAVILKLFVVKVPVVTVI